MTYDRYQITSKNISLLGPNQTMRMDNNFHPLWMRVYLYLFFVGFTEFVIGQHRNLWAINKDKKGIRLV